MRLATLAVAASLLLGGCGGTFTLRASGWGFNAELVADFSEREERNRPERTNGEEEVRDGGDERERPEP